jgi:hypothetical protein
VAERSTTGDDCHQNIKGLSDRDAKQFFKAQNLTQFQRCVDGLPTPLTIEQLEEDLAAYNQSFLT